jgi:hypothetical protein
MDRELHNRLVALVLQVPDIEDFGTRSDLLVNVPNRLELSRSHTNARTDISRLVYQLAKMQLRNGQWALFIFIDNALLRLGDTMNGEHLKELRGEIEASFQQAEQNISPHRPAQSNPQPSASRSIPTPQDSPAGKRMPGAGFPHGYALIVGIAAYRDKRLELSEAIVKDTMGMHTILRAADYCGYTNEHVRLRYDAQATARTIREDLKWLAEVTAADEKATAIFYFSGHGGRTEIDGQISYYLMPFDCDLDNLDKTAIASRELAQLLHAIRPPRLLVLLDNCYSGGMDEIKGTTSAQGALKYGPEEDYYEQLAQGQGRVIIASSSPDQTSRSLSSMNNSLFTYYLLKALRGEVASLSLGDGLTRVIELFSYVYAQVSKARPQKPMMTTSRAENFPIALYRGGKKEQGSTQQSADKQRGEFLEMGIDDTALREAVIRAFTLEELRLLCADIRQALRRNGIDQPFSLDMLEGAGLSGKAQSLIDHCERRGWRSYLITEIRNARPNLKL